METASDSHRHQRSTPVRLRTVRPHMVLRGMWIRPVRLLRGTAVGKMKACDTCQIERPRRKCERCGRMVCSKCAAWVGSSRSVAHGSVTAYCVLDDEECALLAAFSRLGKKEQRSD